MNLLSIEKLSVAYGDVQVLWDVDFHVAPGEIVALVGANGAGKTTLLRTVAGLIPSKSGSVVFDGLDMTQVPAERRLQRGLALVPEGRRLFSGMTVELNLRLGAFLRDTQEEIAADLQRMYDYFPKLGELRHRVAGHLSGGEQQMCAVARALMSRPRLLLVDEMSLGLAPVIVDRLAQVLVQINQAFDVGIVVVEQDVELALQMAQRAHVLEIGRIVLSGSSKNLLSHGDIQRAYLGEMA